MNGLRRERIEGIRVNYLLDGLYVICEFSDSGEVLRKYVPGVCFVSGGSVYFYHYDRLGSVRFMSNEGGNVVQEYVYDVWGNLVSSSGSVSQPYKYLSFYSEGEIGLYLKGKRWYDPKVGRYISRKNSYSINSPYVFSNNNPVSSFPVYTPPISDITTPKEPKGLFPYGNWCGAGWSSGRYTDNPEEVDWSVPAIDSIDQCCKEHDWCVQHTSSLIDKVGTCSGLMCGCLKYNVKDCDKNKNPEAKQVYEYMKRFFCEIISGIK
jgi:RHS repeat-associated protein